MAEKNCFDMTKLIFHIIRLTVVQWSRSCLHVQINRVRLPATLFSVSLYRFFFSCLVSFLTLFFLLAFFPLFSRLTLLVMHLDQWYFKLKSGVLFWKRAFKSSWSAYWQQTVLIYTQHPPVTHWRKLNLPFVLIVLIINIITLKSSLGLPPKNS